jgi:hypothetical protein
MNSESVARGCKAGAKNFRGGRGALPRACFTRRVVPMPCFFPAAEDSRATPSRTAPDQLCA